MRFWPTPGALLVRSWLTPAHRSDSRGAETCRAEPWFLRVPACLVRQNACWAVLAHSCVRVGACRVFRVGRVFGRVCAIVIACFHITVRVVLDDCVFACSCRVGCVPDIYIYKYIYMYIYINIVIYS